LIRLIKPICDFVVLVTTKIAIGLFQAFLLFTGQQWTIVHGKIESLKKVKESLASHGVHHFNSLAEVEKFKREYEQKRRNISKEVIRKFEAELTELIAKEQEQRVFFHKLKKNLEESNQQKINEIARAYQTQKSQQKKLWLGNMLNRAFCIFLNVRNAFWEQIRKKKAKRIISSFGRKLWEINNQITEYQTKRDTLISSRISVQTKDLQRTHQVIKEINPLIAGAIGENLVEKELRKLSDDNILINDFSVAFDPPLYNRKAQDQIFSIQVDHLLISRAGVFVIETKNWSETSLERYDMRSPVEQVRRTGYALYVMLNSRSSFKYGLKHHHWGDKKIPVKNLIAMIHTKPKEEFKYVQIKTLNELTSYISYFDPIFSPNEVLGIFEFQRRKIK